MRVAVTGAGGFVGQGLVDALTMRGAAVTAFDRVAVPGVDNVTGDLTDAPVLNRLARGDWDAVVHLASMPGGAAERDPDTAWQVNVAATRALIAAVSGRARSVRVVFASSIAVFGVPLPADRLDDDTLPLPTLTYGGHKLIGETLVTDATRRGQIDGLSLRLPGILARPRAAGGHLSAYMSDILHAIRAGEDFTCPVAPDARSWFMSRPACVANLVHALTLPDAGPRRALTLPALHLSMAELIAGAEARFGTRARIRFAPDPQLQALFGAYPPLFTPGADALGFVHDGDAETLVARALDGVD